MFGISRDEKRTEEEEEDFSVAMFRLSDMLFRGYEMYPRTAIWMVTWHEKTLAARL